MAALPRTWKRVTPEDRERAAVIHARRTMGSQLVVCEEGGAPLTDGKIITINMDVASRAYVKQGVTCPLCLEWLHA